MDKEKSAEQEVAKKDPVEEAQELVRKHHTDEAIRVAKELDAFMKKNKCKLVVSNRLVGNQLISSIIVQYDESSGMGTKDSPLRAVKEDRKNGGKDGENGGEEHSTASED